MDNSFILVVDVTTTHIHNAIPHCPYTCPIALATIDAFHEFQERDDWRLQNVEVGTALVRNPITGVEATRYCIMIATNAGTYRSIMLPSAIRFMQSFDDLQNVKPYRTPAYFSRIS